MILDVAGDNAETALQFVTPVGQQADYIARAIGVVEPYLPPTTIAPALIEAHAMKFGRNQPRSQPIVRVARLAGPELVALLSFQAHLCLRRLPHLTPPLSCRSGRRL